MTILITSMDYATYERTLEAVEEAKKVADEYLMKYLISFQTHAVLINYLNQIAEEVRNGE